MTPYRDMTDEEWQRVALLLPELRPRNELRGRPLANTRAVLNGVLWVIYSGATWSAMPRRYPSYQTCHRRFTSWYRSGTLKQVLGQLYGAVSEEMYELLKLRMRSREKREMALARPDPPCVQATSSPTQSVRPAQSLALRVAVRMRKLAFMLAHPA